MDGETVETQWARGWWLSVYPQAGEAGGSFRSGGVRPAVRRDAPAADPQRAAEEAARRARSKVRQYCAANRLNRLGTLTYAGKGCHDPVEVRAHVAEFFRGLREGLGGKPLAYLWTVEWHMSGHGLHVHFAVGRFVHRSLIAAAWGRGFVHIKLLGDLPVGSGTLAEARKAARYLSKYVGKDFDRDRRPGQHRYDVAEGFQPSETKVWGRTRDAAIEAACEVMGGHPDQHWFSDSESDWQGPPAVWLSWPG